VIAALVVEVPADVHVRVDESRQQREVAEIDSGRAVRLADARDLAVDNRDGTVLRDAASPIHYTRRPNRRRHAALLSVERND
jgi:hypothetical protein